MFKTMVLVLAMAMGAGSCGYTTGSLLPSNYRTIAIEQFKNKIAYLNEDIRGLYVPLLENKVRDAVVVRFQQDGHLKIAKSGQGDLLLKGDLIGFDREDISLTDDQSVQQYRLRISVALTLIDPAIGEVIWIEPSFSGEALYYTTGPQAKSETVALADAMTDLSRRILERTLENW